MADPTVISSTDTGGFTAEQEAQYNALIQSGLTPQQAIAQLNLQPVQNLQNIPINGVNPTGGNGGSNNNNNIQAVVNSIKTPMATQVIPNPMHEFASWTYAWSLWWLDVNDYNNLISGADAGTALAYPLGPTSYVVAEDSGLFPSRRLPTQFGLNYNIQDVEFNTVVGLNSSSKSSNMIDGSMTILEPYGVTFIDSLVQASFINTPGYNYLQQPYMLQLDFTGYDDSGNPLPASTTTLYRKRFPIRFTGVKVNVTNKGAEYKINYYALGHQSYRPEHSTVPKNLPIVAGTVGGFFDALASALNAFWQLEVLDGKQQYADTISFDIDSAIRQSKIVYDKQLSLGKTNPKGISIDASQGSFSIPAGTQITDVINRVLIQSDYLINQLGLDLQTASEQKTQTTLTQVLNTFKTTCQTTFAGADNSGTVTNGVFDNVRNNYPVAFAYKIHQYAVYDANHPAAPLLSDSRPATLKAYNYLYTGKNIDILDLKINFDTTWYTAIMTYPNQYAASQTSPSTGVDGLLANSGTILLSPQLLASSGIFGSTAIPNLTPLRYKSIVNDQRDNIGMNITDNPAAQTTANMMRSLYSKPSGDMLTVDLQIVGDPTLIKQDDWLYVPSPNGNSDYNNWMSFSQNSFASKYGHIRMDTGALVASLTINTPLDIDTDWTNQGLAFPQPNTYRSLFSGQYKILQIKNTFQSGKFEQTLKLVRIMNSDYVTNSAAATAADGSAVKTSQDNQNSTNNNTQPIPAVSTSISTPASESPTIATVQGTPVNAGTFNMPAAQPVAIPQYAQPLSTNALPNGVQARQ